MFTTCKNVLLPVSHILTFIWNPSVTRGQFWFFFFLNLVYISYSFRTMGYYWVNAIVPKVNALSRKAQASSVTSLRDISVQAFCRFSHMEIIYLLPSPPTPLLCLWCSIWAWCIIILRSFRVNVFLQLLGKLLRFRYYLESASMGMRCGNQMLIE